MIHGLDTSYLVALEVRSHAEHASARSRFHRLLKTEDKVALAPQVLAEFIHVVTDPKRFSAPLSVAEAVERAEIWWNGAEVMQVLPTAESTLLFLQWTGTFRFGRKRLLDTMLASTLRVAGVTSILTLNREDFQVFKVFAFPE